MDERYNAFDVLTIAQNTERNGIIFYRQAAEMFEDEKLRDMFLQLAEWEAAHEQMFSAMKDEVCEEMADRRFFDPEEYMSSTPLLLGELAAQAFKGDAQLEISGKESKEKILKLALKKEKDGIAFYKGLVKFMRDFDARVRVNEIIEEEKKHVGILEQSLEFKG